MKYWSKSALSIYKYLPTMVNTLDKIIMNTGKSSHNSILQKYQSTYCQASKIIELIDRKRKMINLKIAVEDTLNKLDRNSKRLLTLIFIDGAKSEVVAEMLGMSIRTFFRKKSRLLMNFLQYFNARVMIMNSLKVNIHMNCGLCLFIMLVFQNPLLQKIRLTNT